MSLDELRLLLPDWFLQPRRRPELAMAAVVAECDLPGVGTRRVEGLVRTLVIERLSKSPWATACPALTSTLRGPAVRADRDWAEPRIRNLRVSLVR
jgi:transposase-like protein